MVAGDHAVPVRARTTRAPGVEEPRRADPVGADVRLARTPRRMAVPNSARPDAHTPLPLSRAERRPGRVPASPTGSATNPNDVTGLSGTIRLAIENAG
ncbi:hypothetical protein SAMN06297387_12767 [Streptomyces zhaozhouensis]|uniref:Uncharacterized protein n=1 Tax=Streptomyces zhaozhouensis TaxID=1300267 RepID=A0A286E7L2_9ACTN|nr:hypothetical protein SAMN06297387_12767 [Streptomyces zhaozhouensis]